MKLQWVLIFIAIAVLQGCMGPSYHSERGNAIRYISSDSNASGIISEKDDKDVAYGDLKTENPSFDIKHEHSGQRVALVVGNSAYKHINPLPNPVNDSVDVARELRKHGFYVILKTNANIEEMADSIYQFGEILKKGDGVGLFYYAGHGFQYKGENYLLPIETTLRREEDIKYQAISASDVLEKMGEGKSHLNMVFLDACRDNPFSTSRAIRRGLAPMDAPIGTLLVFSTNPGNVALDGEGSNSPFTRYLIKYLNQPGLEIGMMLRKVRTSVKEETNGEQVPWETGSIEGEFYFTDK